MTKVVKKFQSLMSLGLEPSANYFEISQGRALNFITTIITTLCLFYGSVFLFNSTTFNWGLLALLLSLGYLGIYLLNVYGHKKMAQNLFFLFFPMCVFVFSGVFGPGSKIDIWFSSTFLFSLLIFDIKDKRAYVAIFYASLLIIVLQLSNYKIYGMEQLTLSKNYETIIALLMISFSMLTNITCLVYILSQRNLLHRQDVDNLKSLNQILDASNDIVLEIDLNLTFKNIYTSDESKLMVPKSQVLGKLVSDFLPEEIAKKCKEAMAKSLSQKNWVEFEYDLPNYPPNQWRARVCPIFEEHGMAQKFIFFLSDITEIWLLRKRQDENNLKLQESSKMSSLGMIASGIAHEINNPLTIISANAHLIETELSNATINHTFISNLAKKINATSERIAKIVKGLRMYSRETSKDAMTNEDLYSILYSTQSIFYEKFKFNNVDFKIFSNDVCTINCKPSEISQIFLNLLHNSFDAIQESNERWIHCHIYKRLINDKEVATIEFIDSGNGIPEDIVEQMMVPFFTTKPVGQGTGLGLSISQRIAAKHGGKLYFDSSSPNTKFVLDLPITNIHQTESVHLN